jgi:hypothetical protein
VAPREGPRPLQFSGVLRVEAGSRIPHGDLQAAVREVHLACLESREEMPADEVEIVEGEEEGIKLHNSRGPKAVFGDNGTVTGLRTVRCASVFDSAGRFNPSFDETEQYCRGTKNDQAQAA